MLSCVLSRLLVILILESWQTDTVPVPIHAHPNFLSDPLIQGLFRFLSADPRAIAYPHVVNMIAEARIIVYRGFETRIMWKYLQRSEVSPHYCHNSSTIML